MKRDFVMELKSVLEQEIFISLSVALFVFIYAFYKFGIHHQNKVFLNTPAYQNVVDWGKDYHLSAETMADFWIGMDFSTWCATAFFFYYYCYCLTLWQLRSQEYKSGIII